MNKLMPLAALVAGILALSACSGADTEAEPTAAAPSPTATAEPTAAPSPMPAPSPTPTPEPPPEGQSFSGTGPGVVMLDGLDMSWAWLAHIEYTGDDYYSSHAVDANGQQGALISHGIGNYNGTAPLSIWQGQAPAAIKVDGNGSWTITTSLVRDAPEWDGVSPLSGAGDTFYRIADGALTGLTQIKASHDNKYFHIVAYTTTSESRIIDTDAPITDATALIPADTIMLAVMADGNWSITK